MVDTVLCDRITNSVGYLRNNVYNTNEFMDNFSNDIKNNLHTNDVTYIANNNGGWILCINGIEDDKGNHNTYIEYVDKVSKILLNNIEDKDENKYDDIVNGLYELSLVDSNNTTSIILNI